MADNKIKATISLAGVKELVRDLGQVAKEASSAFSSVKKDAENAEKSVQGLGRVASGMTKDFREAAQSVANVMDGLRAAINNVADSANSSFSGMGRSATNAKSAIGGINSEVRRIGGTAKTAALAIAGIAGSVAAAVGMAASKTGSEIAQMKTDADARGMDIGTISRLQYAAKRTGVADPDAVATIFEEISDRMMDAKYEIRESREALTDVSREFGLLGIEQRRLTQDYSQQIAEYNGAAVAFQKAQKAHSMGKITNAEFDSARQNFQQATRSYEDILLQFNDLEMRSVDLQRQQRDLSIGTSDIRMGLSEMGVDPVLPNGELKDSLTIFMEVADAVQRMQKEGKSAQSVMGSLMKSFGDQAARFVFPLAQNGSAGLKQIMSEADKLGVVIGKDLAGSSQQWSTELSVLEAQFTSIRYAVSKALLPEMSKMVAQLSVWLGQNKAVIVEAITNGALKVAQSINDAFQWLVKNKESVGSFFGVIGDGFKQIGTWITSINWEQTFTTFSQAWTTTGKPIIDGILEGLAQIGKALAPLFGRELNATEVGIGLVLLQITGVIPLAVAAVTLLSSALSGLYFAVALVVKPLWSLLALIATKTGVVAAFTGALGFLKGAIIGLVVKVLSPLAAIIGWPALIAAAVVGGLLLIVSNWDTVKATISSAWDFLKSVGTDFKKFVDTEFPTLGKVLSVLGTVLEVVIAGFAKVAGYAWDGIVGGLKGVADWMVRILGLSSDIESLWAGMGNFFSGMKLGTWDSVDGSDMTLARANGGPIYGPGTGTSDSILARLSNGEFVVRAAAVKQYGMGLLHAINSMSLPSSTLPAFASGGLVSGGSSGGSLTLALGGKSFGASAPRSTIDDLVRHSRHSKLARPTKFNGFN